MTEPVKLIGRLRKLHIALRRSPDTLDGLHKWSPFAQGSGLVIRRAPEKEKDVRFCQSSVVTDFFGSFAIRQARTS